MLVSIVDDDHTYAEGTAVLVEGAGFTPRIVTKRLARHVTTAAAELAAGSDAVVCDHRLQPKNMAKYFGAELVAELYRLRKPAILISQFLGPDADVSIRLWRERVPVVLSRDELDGDRIAAGFSLCVDELEGRLRPDRKRVRQLLRIEATTDESKYKVADVVIPGWKATKAVRIPVDLFPSKFHRKVKSGARFFASVNIGAESDEALFFTDFEVAEMPKDDDGLK